MSVLVLDDEKISALKAFAEAHPIDKDEVAKIMAGKWPCAGDRDGHVLHLDLGYTIVYSVEEVPLVNGSGHLWIRHLSVSINRTGYLPSLIALTQISERLGFPPLQNCQISVDGEVYDVMAPLELPIKEEQDDSYAANSERGWS